MRAWMLLFVLLVLTAAPAVAQPAKSDLAAAWFSPAGVYAVPFASQGNVLELAVANPTDASISSVRVAVAEAPAWMVVEPMEIVFEEVAAGAEALARFVFSVGQAAPVGQAATLHLTITSGGAILSEKQILVVAEAPKEIALHGNYPNPFNPRTTISYALPAASQVDLRIYDLLGREVARLVSGEQAAGYREAVWEAGRFASGLYLYRLMVNDEAGDRTVKQRMMLLVK